MAFRDPTSESKNSCRPICCWTYLGGFDELLDECIECGYAVVKSKCSDVFTEIVGQLASELVQFGLIHLQLLQLALSRLITHTDAQLRVTHRQWSFHFWGGRGRFLPGRFSYSNKKILSPPVFLLGEGGLSLPRYRPPSGKGREGKGSK